MTIRERTQQAEQRLLSRHAALSKNSLGRKRDEPECDLRTVYQRDRDRIIHCKAFRRLKHKTQVFLSPEKDHYRTRLTHTLEVSQIARTIARALRLNEDLTEAIALAHDLGHTPFGHAGEAALNAVAEQDFRHYEQSVRVIEVLENNGQGLNLTREVCNGVLCHTKGEQAFTLEGQVVRIADRIAYTNHDVDDAVRAGVLKEDALPAQVTKILGNKRVRRVDALISSLIENSAGGQLKMDPMTHEAFEMLHSFMYESVYNNPCAKVEERKVPALVEQLYKYFKKNYTQMPEELQKIAHQEGIDRAVCDYIAGMTDQFAVKTFENIFVPRAWKI